MFDLKGRKALATGSTQGIGYAIAKTLLQQGATVYILGGGNEEKTRAAAMSIGTPHYITQNLAECNAAEKIYSITGPVDIVVANASVQSRKTWSDITEEDFDWQIDVNLKSTLALMQKYIPDMQKKGWGRFLAVGSVQQYRPHKDMAVYAASKCALQSLVENIAKQVARDGVTVNCLIPGVIATPRNDGALSDNEYKEKVLSSIPAGFIGNAEDCAFGALYLCSDESRYVTGAKLVIDGGMKL